MTIIYPMAVRAQGRHRGQAVVEFALVLPVFMLMVFGAIEFGRAYYDVHLLTTAAREGSRVGVLPAKVDADVNNAVNNFLQSTHLSGGWTTTIAVKDVSGTTRTGGLPAALEGDRIYVTVNYNFQVMVGRVLPGFRGTVPLHGRCVMRHE